MNKKLNWQAYSSIEPHVAIQRISTIINKHGYILSFQRFSDLAINFLVEVDQGGLLDLYRELKTFASLDGTIDLEAEYTGDYFVFLNVSFASGTGDHRIEVPSIPG
jgi:hypothetical protein